MEEAIQTLDFRPNPLARGLRTGHGMTIGVLTQETDSPFFGTCLRGIEEGLSGSDFAPVIVSAHWNAREEADRISLLISRYVSGIVLLNGMLDEKQILDFARSLPIVVVGRRLPPRNVFSMAIDNVRGGYLATRHLIELGHRQIAHVSGPANHLDATDRLKGYRKALQQAQIPYDPELVSNAGFVSSGGLLAANRLLDSQRRFTALFAANDESAYGAQLGLHRHGMRVPDDVSLVGYDDLPGSKYRTPPLTAVHQPLLEMGRRAARAVLDMIGGRPPGGEGIPDVELVVRETTRRVR